MSSSGEISRGSVLLVDDDQMEHSLFRRAFLANQVELIGFFSAEEAIEYRSKVRPRFALVDLNMPGGGGFHFLSARSKSDQSYLPVLLMSSSVTPNRVRMAYAQGASGIFEKPSDYRALKDLVGTLVEYWFGIMSMPPSPV